MALAPDQSQARAAVSTSSPKRAPVPASRPERATVPASGPMSASDPECSLEWTPEPSPVPVSARGPGVFLNTFFLWGLYVSGRRGRAEC